MSNGDLARLFIQALQKTQVSYRQAIQRCLKSNNVGMTFEMLQIMACLWRQQGVNQQELANKTFKDKASLTYLINKLSDKGWVVRCEDAHDRRNKPIFLTEEGEKMRDIVMPLLSDIYRVAGENLDPGHILIGIEYLQELEYGFERYEV